MSDVCVTDSMAFPSQVQQCVQMHVLKYELDGTVSSELNCTSHECVVSEFSLQSCADNGYLGYQHSSWLSSVGYRLLGVQIKGWHFP